MIAESQELGESTIENLNDQAAQIADIDAEISVIDSNLKRAEKLITSFTRRMATDKIIQGFAVLNIVVLTVLIAYVLITGKSLGGGDAKDAETVGPSTTTMPTPMPTFTPTV
jgi:SNARE protein